MVKKGSLNITKYIITILGFLLIGSGAYLARFNVDEKVTIIGGIVVAVGMGLLAFARTI